MSGTLEKFKIEKLHGYKTIEATLKDNILIFVGENGSGKTTILRMLYYFLSGEWEGLIQFKFEYICVTIDGKEYKEFYESLQSLLCTNKYLRRVPLQIRQRVDNLLSGGEYRHAMMELDRFNHRYPEYFLHRQEICSELPEGKKDEDIVEKRDAIRAAIGAQVLYLPTYRRIEQELSTIFEGIDMESLRRKHYKFNSPGFNFGYIELVEFGMQDVKYSIDKKLEELKEFAREELNKLTLRYLDNIVGKEYENIDMKKKTNISEKTIDDVLSRIPSKILREEHKSSLRNIINSSRTSKELNEEYQKIIYHYFLKLLEFQEALQKKEAHITAFCVLCSEYLRDKKFSYDSSTFSFSISCDSIDKRTDLELSDLSSGEKQIVSLFSHLYLSGQENYFILIDEPELSLSVPWQKRFLCDVYDGEFCKGLIAATHSPFIYANKLRCYTHSLGEFISFHRKMK